MLADELPGVERCRKGPIELVAKPVAARTGVRERRNSVL